MPPCNCHPPFPRPEPFSPLPRPGKIPDWGKWIRDRLAEKGALLVFPSASAFPSAGDGPNLYLAEDTGVLYRWDGKAYAVLFDPSASDVETYPGRSAFPDTGRAGAIYIDASANLLYRWDGTGYVLLTPDLSGVESRLAGVESKVPAQATAQNQLADKAFVNSSIATNTAFYISDNGRPFQSLADLESYEGALTNNDYAFVVGRDAAGNTTYTRYKWNEATEAWAEEYVLNNSSFTAEQWAAISSGITSGLVAKLGALPTAEALAQALAGKQDRLTFETSVTRNSDNPVKSSGIWSAIWGTLTALPAGFTSLYDWCVAQLAPKADKTITVVPAHGLPADCYPVVYVKDGTTHTITGDADIRETGPRYYTLYDSDKMVCHFARSTGEYFADAGTTSITFNGTAPTQNMWPVLTSAAVTSNVVYDKDIVAPSTAPAVSGKAADAKSTGDALAGKASKADATLTERGFAEWVCNPSTILLNGTTYPAVVYRYAPAPGSVFWAVGQSVGGAPYAIQPYDEAATSLTFSLENVFEPRTITATRTRTDIIGYTLGSQTDRPLASEAEAEALRQGKADRAANPTAGNLAALDASGNPTDSGKKASDFATAAQGAKADAALSRAEAEAGFTEWVCQPDTVTVSWDDSRGGWVTSPIESTPQSDEAYNPNATNIEFYLEAGGGRVTATRTRLPTMADVNAKLASTSAAPAFSTSSTYTVGEHVTYNGKLYRCTTAVTTAGAWTGDTNWTADTMTDPDAVLDVTSQNQLRVVAKDGTVLWSQGYDLASTSSATLACDATNNFTFADGATTQAFTLPTAPTGKVGDFGLDIDNSANTGTATMTLTGLDTTFSVVVPEGESLNDMLAIAAGELARFYITLSTFRVNNLPTWHIVKQVVENGGVQS